MAPYGSVLGNPYVAGESPTFAIPSTMVVYDPDNTHKVPRQAEPKKRSRNKSKRSDDQLFIKAANQHFRDSFQEHLLSLSSETRSSRQIHYQCKQGLTVLHVLLCSVREIISGDCNFPLATAVDIILEKARKRESKKGDLLLITTATNETALHCAGTCASEASTWSWQAKRSEHNSLTRDTWTRLVIKKRLFPLFAIFARHSFSNTHSRSLRSQLGAATA